jgi:hypothetical protein
VAVIVLLWSRGEAGSTTAFCNSLRNGPNPVHIFDQYDPSNVGLASQQLQQGVARLKELQDAAPGEIRDDMKVLVDFGEQLIGALSPSNTTVPDFSGASEKVATASGNVVQFTATHCNVQLDSGASTTSTSTPASS